MRLKDTNLQLRLKGTQAVRDGILASLENAEKELERVTKLREQLNHNFDPQKTQSLMEQYSSLTAPNQSRIYWLPEKNQQ